MLFVLVGSFMYVLVGGFGVMVSFSCRYITHSEPVVNNIVKHTRTHTHTHTHTHTVKAEARLGLCLPTGPLYRRVSLWVPMGVLWENLYSNDICPINLAQGYACVGGASHVGGQDPPYVGY